MSKLIAISGSQGSGKTVLCNALAQSGYTVVTRKTSRSILNDWGTTLDQVNSNPGLTIRFQDAILSRKQLDDLELLQTNPVVITERSFIDLFVYALVALGASNRFSAWLDEYFERCVEAQKIYTNTVYLTAGYFKVEHDGIRGSNGHYSRMVDVTMQDYIKQFNQRAKSSFHIIDAPVLETRVSKVCKIIRGDS